MGRVRLILISLVALVVAIGAAFVARGMASPPAPKTVIVEKGPPPAPVVRVLVARRELAVGDRLDEAAMNWQSWPAAGINPAFVTDGGAPAVALTDAKAKLAAAAGDAASAAKSAIGAGSGRMAAYVGAVVRQPIALNEPITDDKLVRAGAGGVLAVTLQPGMRAMSVPLSTENAAGGFIMPGDHVDVVQVQRAAAGVDARTVMRNVRVLAIDQETRADGKVVAKSGSSATLELSPGQAEDMVLAKAQGDLTLVLRSYADAAGPAHTGEIHRLAEESPVVHVFRDGQATDVKVSR